MEEKTKFIFVSRQGEMIAFNNDRLTSWAERTDGGFTREVMTVKELHENHELRRTLNLMAFSELQDFINYLGSFNHTNLKPDTEIYICYHDH